MPHNRYVGYIDEHNRGFVVAFTIHWEVIEAQRVDPRIGAGQALGDFIARFEADGWQAESDARYGFTFMHRGGVRILRGDAARSLGYIRPGVQSVQMIDRP